MKVKIEKDIKYQYFVVSIFNRKIEDAYEELAKFLVQYLSLHFDFGLFLTEDVWQNESRLLHYFKISKQKLYKSIFSLEQLEQCETLIRHPLDSHLIRYCSYFRLDFSQLKEALALNASGSFGRSFVYLKRKGCNESQFLDSKLLFEYGGFKDSIDWNQLEDVLKIQQIYPIQKWEACYEISIRLSNDIKL
jgi:hypothetical protein